MGRKIRILIAEDHAILRDGLRIIIDSDPDLCVVAEAGDGLETIRRIEQVRPDIILLDISMPRTNGIDVIRAIRRSGDPTKILVLTVHREKEYISAALKAGANGYVLKDTSEEELRVAIKTVIAGQRYVSQRLSERSIEELQEEDTGNDDSLSPRQRQVLIMIAEGLQNKEIAVALNISPKTVEKHRASLMDKLGLRTVAGLTAYVVKRGMLAEP